MMRGNAKAGARWKGKMMKSSKVAHLRQVSRRTGLGIAMAVAGILTLAWALAMREAGVSDAAMADPGALTEVAEPPTASATTLLVATDPTYWPMEYISGTLIVGHDIDLMNAVAAEMSVTVVYTNVAWAVIFPGLIAGEYDAIISTLTVTPAREAVMDFTLPYATFGDDENIAIAVQQGDDTLRRQMNEALRKLRADGTLETIIAAIAADMPQWQAHLPRWPCIFVPLVLRSSGQ